MYVVAGVTGHIGSVVAEELLGRGTQVRVIVRTEAQAEAWRVKRAKVVVGRLEDTGFLASALRGATGAFLLLPPNPAAADLPAWQRSVVDSIASACARSTLGHAVILSSVGAQHAEGTGPIAALHLLEQRARVAAAQVTVLRPCSFMENLLAVLPVAVQKGVLPTMIAGDAPMAMIATRDIGKLAAERLIDPPDANAIYELAGPEYRMSQVAALLSRLLQKPIAVAHVPPEAQATALEEAGMGASTAAALSEMYRAAQSGRLTFEGGKAQLVRARTALEHLLPEWVARFANR